MCHPEAELFDYFPTANAFAEVLYDATACANVSRTIITSHVQHMGRGLEYYFQLLNITGPDVKSRLFVARCARLPRDMRDSSP